MSVLVARARGEKWADLAESLYISPGVARENMAAVYSKFGSLVKHPTAAEIAWQLGLDTH